MRSMVDMACSLSIHFTCLQLCSSQTNGWDVPFTFNCRGGPWLVQNRGWQTFFWERQLVNILNFAGHKISVSARHHSTEVTRDNPYTNEYVLECVPKQLCLQKHGIGWIWPVPIVFWLPRLEQLLSAGFLIWTTQHRKWFEWPCSQFSWGWQDPEPWFSKCGLQSYSISITWGLDRKAKSQDPLLNQKLWGWGSVVCIFMSLPHDSGTHSRLL